MNIKTSIAASPRIVIPRLLPALLLSSLLGACAQLPAASERASLFEEQQLNGNNPAQASAIPWPDQQWWQSYQDPQLDTLIREALTNAPDMTTAIARLQAAAAAAGVADSALLPALNANLAVSRDKQSYNYLTPESMTPQGLHNYGRATLDFSWQLDFWGRNRATLAAATSRLTAAEAELAQARLSLAAGVASAYTELAHLYASRTTLQRALEIRSQTAALMQQRYDNGLETLASLRRAQSLRASAEIDLLVTDEQISLQRHQLAALLGATPERGQQIQEPSLLLQQPPEVPANVGIDLLGRRPDVVAARLQAEAAASSIQARKADFYPNVSLGAFIGVHSLGLDQLTDSGSGVASFGPAVSLPIFNTGYLQGALRTAEADYDQAVAGYNRTLIHALQEVADVSTSQHSLQARIAKTEEALAAASEAWQISRNRYQGGLDSYLDVLNAEDLLLANQRALTDLRARALTLDVALQTALGGGYQSTRS